MTAPSWWREALLGVAVAVFLAAGLHQASRDALVPDEAADLAGGLVVVEHGDLRMVPEHGVLHRLAVGLLPSLVADPIVPRTAAYADGDWFDHTEELVSANDRAGRLDEVLLWARVLPLLLAAGTGVGLFLLGRELFGRDAGLVSALLWLTTPYVVGIGHLSALDVTFTASLVLVAVLLARALEAPTLGRVAAVAASVGIAALVRHQAVVLVPVVAVVLAWRGGDARERRVLGSTALVVPVVVVWAVMAPFGPVTGDPGARFDALIATAASDGLAGRLAMLVPLPDAWRAGLAYLVVTNESRPAYLAGMAWEGGRAWYLPLSMLLKLPLTATVAVVAGAFAWWRTRAGGRRAPVVIGAVFGTQTVVLLAQSLNLGVRLALPILAGAFLIAGALARLVRGPAGALAVGVLAMGQVAAFAVALPTSLAWTPPPVTDGYRVLSDSSVDIGQANAILREEHERDPFVAATVLAPRGQPGLAGVPHIADAEPEDLVGRVAVGATPLSTTSRSALAWLRAYCPVEVLEGSILVYRFASPPDTSLSRDVPAPPCDGSESHPR